MDGVRETLRSRQGQEEHMDQSLQVAETSLAEQLVRLTLTRRTVVRSDRRGFTQECLA